VRVWLKRDPSRVNAIRGGSVVLDLHLGRVIDGICGACFIQGGFAIVTFTSPLEKRPMNLAVVVRTVAVAAPLGAVPQAGKKRNWLSQDSPQAIVNRGRERLAGKKLRTTVGIIDRKLVAGIC